MDTHICFLSSAHGATDTRMFYKQCRSLSSAGYKVTLVAPHSRDDVVDGVRIKSIPHARNRLSRMTLNVIRVCQKALRENAEVYHFHDPELIPIGLLLKALGKKVVYDVREDVPRDILDKKWIPSPLRLPASNIMESFGRFAVRHLSGLVAAAEEMVKPFGEVGVPVTVVHNYPMLEEFVSADSFDSKRYSAGVVACFGGVCYLTGTRELIAALGLMPAGMPVKLVLGGLTESEELLQEVQQMPGWSRVAFLGMTPRKEMIPVLTEASVAVVLYNSQRRNLTSLSNATKIFESMAAGLPVIVPNMPEWSEFVEYHRCGIAVSPEDPQAIAQAIQKLVTHPEEAAEMGKRGREVVARYFSWESEHGKLITFYSELLANRGASRGAGSAAA